jgi:hypothetical protein
VLLLLLVLAALAALAVGRVIRVRTGHEPQPDGGRMIVLAIFAFLVPPIALQTLLVPVPTKGQLDGVSATMLFGVLVLGFFVAMWIAARVTAKFAPANLRPLLLLALSGDETPANMPFDAAMTGSLLEGTALVDTRNAAFPRGRDFLDQVNRPDFRAAWDSLDAATKNLEAGIAEAGRLHLGVAPRASQTATDARARLDVLRIDAAGHGQAWAV